MAKEIPDDYLGMMIRCPFPAGQTAGAMAVGDFLQTEQGQEYLPDILKNIETADKIFATGAFTADEAVQAAFGGAFVTTEAGEIMRQPKEPETVEPSLTTTPEAEKKSVS